MKFVQAGFDLLKQWEGCSLVAYQDAGDVWTIGYGHTAGVQRGDTITPDQALELLNQDVYAMSVRVATVMSPLVSTRINDNQFTALCCFAFNVKSWEDTPLFTLLDNCQWALCEAHWLLYDKELIDGTKQEVNGLLNRRKAELALFLTPVGN